MSYESALPFPRGSTMSDAALSGVTPAAGDYKGIAGRTYEVADTVHGTGRTVTLIALKNGSSDLTVARRFLEFSAAAPLDWGRVVAGYCDTAGAVVVALDDAYVVGDTIKAYDVFWGVLKGPVGVLTETSSVNLAAGNAVASDGSGYVNGAAAAAGEFVAGHIDAASTTAAEVVVVHMAGNLAMPDPAG